jgi:hypothetical protein
MEAYILENNELHAYVVKSDDQWPCTDAELALGGAWFPFDQLEHAKANADGARLASPALMRRPEARELPGVQHLREMIKT